MQSIHKWYFPLWSKLEFYRTASDILEKSVTDMPLSSLENACITWDPSLAATTGLGGLEAKYDLSIDGAGVINFKGKSKYGMGNTHINFISTCMKWFPFLNAAKSGKHVLTLSDNKNFIVGVTCWDDEEGSYGIWTPKPQLSAGDKEIIVKHLEELGFGMDFMVETPYDKCESERSTDFGEKVEL